MDFNTLIEIIEEAGYTPYSYSGRGMYGDRCVGFTTDGPLLATIATIINEVAYIHGHETEDKIFEFAAVLKYAATDNMGLSTVVYFPRVTWEGE